MNGASDDIIPVAVGGRSCRIALLLNPIRRRRADEPISFDTGDRKKKRKGKRNGQLRSLACREDEVDALARGVFKDSSLTKTARTTFFLFV